MMDNIYLSNILKQIAHQHGITILAQPRLKGLILDLMPTAERKHINVLKRAIDEQIGTKLLEMQHDDPAVRHIKVTTLKEKFKNDNAFDDTAFYIVDCFVDALGWNNSEPEIILPFKEIKIGNQIWADRNLDVSHFRNGDPIPEARTVEEWKKAGEKEQSAWCYYDNDTENGKKYGKLYNWYTINDPRGLTPEGWQVPNKWEWIELSEYLGGDVVSGLKIKDLHEWGENETNDMCFSALPGGYRNLEEHCDVGNGGYFWSSSMHSTTLAWFLGLGLGWGGVNIDFARKEFGFSVRCIRDLAI